MLQQLGSFLQLTPPKTQAVSFQQPQASTRTASSVLFQQPDSFSFGQTETRIPYQTGAKSPKQEKKEVEQRKTAGKK